LENGVSTEVIKVPVNEELSKELRGSVVGSLARERNVKRIQTTLFMEGFPSISVTHMGDNKVLMRSPVEGDVERLMKSKNECLKYYFSEIKPWNPGLTAAQREVWVQIYGISVHIWGDDLFKLVGKRFGVFLDYDEETVRMKRLDVARIKILTTVWASIDVVLKVEVEGLFFDLWVVEERERKVPLVALNEEMEDEGSRVVPAEESVGGEEAYEEEALNSGEDDESGEEIDADVVIGEGHENENDGTRGSQKLNEGGKALTCTKSKEFVNTNMEIPYAPQAVAEKVDQVEQVLSLASSEEVGVRNEIGVCGSKLIEETNSILENVGTGGPHLVVGNLNDVVGYQGPISDPCDMGRGEPNGAELDRSFRGVLVEDGVSRFSSLSEPEEVLSPFRSKNPKLIFRARHRKSQAAANKLGVPNCIKFAEAVKEMSSKLRKRKQKGGVSPMKRKEDGGNFVSPTELISNAAVLISSDVNPNSLEDNGRSIKQRGGTPTSGINLLSGSDLSRVPDFMPPGFEDEREKLVEAAKLLNIQLEVGFNFEETTNETLEYLIDQERCDRAKKMDWEQRGDQ
jgi:hypothetical protein